MKKVGGALAAGWVGGSWMGGRVVGLEGRSKRRRGQGEEERAVLGVRSCALESGGPLRRAEGGGLARRSCQNGGLKENGEEEGTEPRRGRSGASSCRSGLVLRAGVGGVKEPGCV